MSGISSATRRGKQVVGAVCRGPCLLSGDHSWVKPFILKDAPYHVETQARELRTPDGILMLSIQRIVARR